MIYKVQ